MQQNRETLDRPRCGSSTAPLISPETHMIRAGFETTDPFTQTRSVVVEGAEETDGRGWVIEVHCPEGALPAILEHVHLTW